MLSRTIKLAGPQPRGDGLGRLDDVSQVGLAGFGERRRDADDDRRRARRVARKSGWPRSPARASGGSSHRGCGRCSSALLELGDLDGVDVEPEDGDPSFREGPCQGQADIAQSDDSRRAPSPTRSWTEQCLCQDDSARTVAVVTRLSALDSLRLTSFGSTSLGTCVAVGPDHVHPIAIYPTPLSATAIRAGIVTEHGSSCSRVSLELGSRSAQRAFRTRAR